MKTANGYELTRVKNDVNGNPRYVIHFLALLPDTVTNNYGSSLNDRYNMALKNARKHGGKVYRGKEYGGGIVFQSYNTNELISFIESVQKGE
jgi:hypothetical protein